MKRRDILLGALGLVAASTLRAEDEFEAFKRSQEQGFGQFRNDRETEFKSYQAELDAALAAYSQSFAEAARAQERELQAIWRNPELSSRHRWVEYSADNAIQRVVDFERNEVRISVRSDRIKASDALLREQLQTLLTEDKGTAFKRDPVSQAVEQSVGAVGPNAVQQAKVSNERVLGELFDSPQPSAREVAAKAQQMAAAAVRESGANHVVTITVPLPEDRPLRKAEQFQEPVKQYAADWRVEQALLLAVIHTESSFNPMARSPVPAYGLMQIVPRSAGQDATKLVFGKPKVVAPSYLYDAEKNIQLGAAYLHLLMNRYLNAVTDPEARLYCAVAAYNTGTGNVARSFVGSTNVSRAAAKINERTPAQVYEHMLGNLPYEETRHYLQRVVGRIQSYRS